MSKLCLTITEKRISDSIEICKKYESSVDMYEFRIDFLEKSELENLDNFKSSKPVILTYRKVKDGGQYSGSEEFRLQVLSQGIKTGNFAYVDLEEDLISPEIERVAEKNSVKIIRSFHDFNGVPKNLAQKLQSIKRSEKEIPKAAVMIKNSKELLAFYKEALKIVDKDKILLGMGNTGFNTRILAAKIGSYLTFCSKDGASAAPGHVSPEVLNKTYQFRNISRDSAIFGIIGNPLMHTKSPEIHNSGYKKLGIDAVYVPFEIDNPETFMSIAELLGIRGFSVTVPFKSDIIPCLDSVTNSVKEIGACNTVTRIGKSWVGENSDYVGFINPLKREYGSLEGKKVTVIGAGGAAKASIYALKNEGAKILVLNRTVEKAEELAEEFDTEFSGLDEDGIIKLKDYNDVIIQTTNVGMHPMENIDPVNYYNFTGSEFLYDIIYNPETTKFLERGRNSGCKILNGWQMLLEQGYRQFKLFTGMEYPV